MLRRVGWCAEAEVRGQESGPVRVGCFIGQDERSVCDATAFASCSLCWRARGREEIMTRAWKPVSSAAQLERCSIFDMDICAGRFSQKDSGIVA